MHVCPCVHVHVCECVLVQSETQALSHYHFNCQALTSQGELMGKVEQKVDNLAFRFFSVCVYVYA